MTRTTTRTDELRIVSLIASATEILCALGLRDRMVGRSHECDYPPDVDELPVMSAPKVNPALPGYQIDREVRAMVGDAMSVYRVDVDQLERLRPDLIVTQDHCEVCAVSLRDVEDALCQLTTPNTSICTLHPNTLADVYDDIRRVSHAAGVPDRGRALVEEMQSRLDAVAARTGTERPRRIALIEWLEPPMIAGGWMPELARVAGAQPVIVEAPESFSTVTWEDIAAATPEHIVVMPCGYDLDRIRLELERDDVSRPLRTLIDRTGAPCHLADGNAFFNRPGPRLADTAELLAGLVHPTVSPTWERTYGAATSPWPR